MSLPSGIVLRDAIEADMAAIAAIYSHHVLTGTATFETEPPTAAEMERRRRLVRDLGAPYLVAEGPEGIVGYGYVGSYRPRAAYKFTVEDSIYLRADQTGRGIGRALLTRILADAETAGFRQVVAVIGDSANVASVRLHRSLGFVETGTLHDVGFKFGRWLDTVLMQRTLHPRQTQV